MLRGLGFPRMVSLDNFRQPNFPLVAEVDDVSLPPRSLQLRPPPCPRSCPGMRVAHQKRAPRRRWIVTHRHSLAQIILWLARRFDPQATLPEDIEV